jgi:DNA modification methylase
MKLLHGDCLELMKTISDQSIDMVLTDPPYGTTAKDATYFEIAKKRIEES